MLRTEPLPLTRSGSGLDRSLKTQAAASQVIFFRVVWNVYAQTLSYFLTFELLIIFGHVILKSFSSQAL